jgi:hypothetical protein
MIKNELPTKGHFFASNAFEWQTSDNVEKLLKDMRRRKYPFNIFYVPLPEADEYQIRDYTPLVEGIIWLGYFD